MELNHVYFIIGNAYAGKSTMVRRLSERHCGIACRENYHEQLMDSAMSTAEFPCLCYTRDLQDWHDFIRRTPEEYEAWVNGAARECEILELRILKEITEKGKPVFVDTNISIETLRHLTDRNHVLVMLADPEISVNRFFERPDKEKQFLYRLMLEEPDPEKSLNNFRECLKRINSQERYQAFLDSGYTIILRDEDRTIEETLLLAEKAFRLPSRPAESLRIEKAGKGSVLSDELLEFVEQCSWTDAKDHIANLIRNGEFSDWETMFAAIQDGKIVGMASVMKTDYYPLTDIYPWISSIFVSEKYRGRKISGKLIEYANQYLKQNGFSKSYIPCEFSGLYEQFGYSFVKEIVNYGGGNDRLYIKELERS